MSLFSTVTVTVKLNKYNIFYLFKFTLAATVHNYLTAQHHD